MKILKRNGDNMGKDEMPVMVAYWAAISGGILAAVMNNVGVAAVSVIVMLLPIAERLDKISKKD